MAAFLVTGNPGSGKSTVALELQRRGFDAVDPDYDPDLSHWQGPDGRVVERADAPADPDVAWLRSHKWVWSRNRLLELLRSPQDMFVCGIALNIEEVADLFDRIFVLEIDEETQEERLAAHDATHPPGRNEAGRQQIRDGRVSFQEQMVLRGATPINASNPTEAVVDELLGHLGPARP